MATSGPSSLMQPPQLPRKHLEKFLSLKDKPKDQAQQIVNSFTSDEMQSFKVFVLYNEHLKTQEEVERRKINITRLTQEENNLRIRELQLQQQLEELKTKRDLAVQQLDFGLNKAALTIMFPSERDSNFKSSANVRDSSTRKKGQRPN